MSLCLYQLLVYVIIGVASGVVGVLFVKACAELASYGKVRDGEAPGERRQERVGCGKGEQEELPHLFDACAVPAGVNGSGVKVRVAADRCSGDGCCAIVTDTSNGVVLYEAEMVDGERAEAVAADAAAHPTWFSYLYTQAVEYAKLKSVCAEHALADTTPPGVSTIEIAIEALKLAEYLTPVLTAKLKK